MWLEMPKDLQKEAIGLRKIRGAIPLIVLMTVALALIGFGENNISAAGYFSRIGLGFLLAIIFWRVCVSKAVKLAKKAHAWAAIEVKVTEPWFAQKADASAIYAPWIPNGTQRFKAAMRLLSGRSLK